MSARHPSDLALEEHVLNPETSVVAGHVASCAYCRRRLDQMAREAEEFRRFVFPQTIDRIEEAAAGRSGRSWLRTILPFPAVAAAAAAAVFFVMRPEAPPDDYVGVKGAGDLGLTVFTQADGAPRILADGARVDANASLRFRVRSASPCDLVLVSVDADGNVSRLDPAGSRAFALSAGGQDLPGGVQLDGRPGPERVFAVCAPGLEPETAVESARRAASGGANAVRRVSVLRGLPADATQTTLLIEKTP